MKIRRAIVAAAFVVGSVTVASVAAPVSTASVGALPPEGSVSWIAMGDSLAAGSGLATVPVGDACRRGTGLGGVGAAAAPGARAQLEAQRFAAPADRFKFVACAGAVASDWVKQFSESGSTPADLVTLSFGADDVGLTKAMDDCTGAGRLDSSWDWSGPTFPSAVPWSGCTTTPAELTSNVDAWTSGSGGAGVALPTLLSGVAASAVVPGGKILVVGYPMPFEESGRWAAWHVGRCARVNASDADALRGVVAHLDERIAAAVAAVTGKVNGVEVDYVDVASLFEGPAGRHGLCSADEWVDGISDPPSRSLQVDQRGQDAIAAAVAQKVSQLDFSTVVQRPDCTQDAVLNATRRWDADQGRASTLRIDGLDCEGAWARACAYSPVTGPTDCDTYYRWEGGGWSVLSQEWDICPPELEALGVPNDVATRLAKNCHDEGGG